MPYQRSAAVFAPSPLRQEYRPGPPRRPEVGSLSPATYERIQKLDRDIEEWQGMDGPAAVMYMGGEVEEELALWEVACMVQESVMERKALRAGLFEGFLESNSELRAAIKEKGEELAAVQEKLEEAKKKLEETSKATAEGEGKEKDE